MTLLEMSGGMDAVSGGMTIAVVGWIIVLIVLSILSILFFYLQKVLTFNLRSQLKNLKGKNNSTEDISVSDITISGDVNAAIAMGLYMYFNELHIEESGVITIKKVEKRYSPWSSKFYGLNNFSK